jgi:hypothetical protein
MKGTYQLTRWILEARADEPWFMLDALGSSNTYQTVGRRKGELDDMWSVRVEAGSFKSERISKL